ncbi:DNA recombination protein RmuC [Pontibaca sp. S1109L]|uniref:DNA recombination protein RmuC homolog n=2 Tax=Pontibaca salina TaxID=2795731 RepID=A0A934HPM8_9RHOB|nr:DNA recombination protein RmuC [Pontibaca salina]
MAALWLVWMGKLSRAQTALKAAERHAGELRQELTVRTVEAERLPALEERLTQIDRLYDTEKEARISAQTALESLKREHAGRLEELRDMKKELEDRFETLASGVLQKNSEQFLGLVSERFQKHSQSASEDIEKRQLAISNLVKPLDEKLGQFDQRIKEIETARNEAYGAIRQQVHELAQGQMTLGQETRKLVQALRAPKTRGRWGEMQLRQVFDMAGMSENVDYTLEKQINTDNGAQRPDAIVQIPGGKSIVIDAKTPLDAYLNALESDTPEAQQQQLTRHAGQVRTHVRLLSSKAYQDAIATTPDFVVMFIPGETFVSAAVEADPSLLEFAFENKVLISTPTTLMALIKAIAYGWQQEKMAENAAEVQRVARELYDRLGRFGEHLGRVGTHLDRAVGSYNSAVGSMEGRVLPSARKFEAMGVVPPKTEIAAPTVIESETRQLTASELTD